MDPMVEKVAEEGGNMAHSEENLESTDVEEESTGMAAKRKQYVMIGANIRKSSCVALNTVMLGMASNFAE